MDQVSSGSPVPWWGTFSLEAETGGRWDIGPSTVWVYRSTRDWRVIHQPADDPVAADPLAERSAHTVPVSVEEMTALLDGEDDAVTTHRYPVESTDEEVALEPVLADRPVVVRPEHPLSILPGETVTLYVSTPLWVRVMLAASDRTLQEVPSQRISDTWFGPSTREGELCYAVRVAGRLHLDRLPLRLHRALTPLHVRNGGKDVLAVERVQLPTPHLALYRTPADVLWTQAVTMSRREGTEGAVVDIKKGAPYEMSDAVLVERPRTPLEKGLFTSTFSAFGAFFGA